MVSSGPPNSVQGAAQQYCEYSQRYTPRWSPARAATCFSTSTEPPFSLWLRSGHDSLRLNTVSATIAAATATTPTLRFNSRLTTRKPSVTPHPMSSTIEGTTLVTNRRVAHMRYGELRV